MTSWRKVNGKAGPWLTQFPDRGEGVEDAYAAMDERRSVRTPLRPSAA